MDTLDLLVCARGEIEKGWVNTWGCTPGRVCAIGALILAGGLPDDVPLYFIPGYSALERAHGDYMGAWNDVQTSVAPVLALYDRAIAAEVVKVTADPAHVHAQAA